jgi:hypothetical protein
VSAYRVQFDVNGGSPAPSDVFCVQGTAITKPSTEPEKENNLFLYWQNESGTKVRFPFEPKSDTVLTAKWIKSTASIRLTNQPSFEPGDNKKEAGTFSLSSMGLDLNELAEADYSSVTFTLTLKYKTNSFEVCNLTYYLNNGSDEIWTLTGSRVNTGNEFRSYSNSFSVTELKSETFTEYGKAEKVYDWLFDTGDKWTLGERTYTITFNK